MSKSSEHPAPECPLDAEVLLEISALLEGSSRLHVALMDLIAEKHAAAAQSSALHAALGAQLRAHSAKFGASQQAWEVNRAAPSHRDQALQALANADPEKALHYIALCDADAVRLIERRRRTPGVSPDTKNLLALVHSILLHTSLNRMAKA